jgi:hypothetical protein
VIRVSPVWLPPAAFGVAFLLSAGTPPARPEAPPAPALAALPAALAPAVTPQGDPSAAPTKTAADGATATIASMRLPKATVRRTAKKKAHSSRHAARKKAHSSRHAATKRAGSERGTTRPMSVPTVSPAPSGSSAPTTSTPAAAPQVRVQPAAPATKAKPAQGKDFDSSGGFDSQG